MTSYIVDYALWNLSHAVFLSPPHALQCWLNNTTWVELQVNLHGCQKWNHWLKAQKTYQASRPNSRVKFNRSRGKTDNPSMISWQRLSSWFKTVAICLSFTIVYWDQILSCSALISTSWERNVSLKETTSHSRKPEKSFALTKLPAYNSKQWQAKLIQHKSAHYVEPKATLKPNREARETTNSKNKEMTSN